MGYEGKTGDLLTFVWPVDLGEMDFPNHCMQWGIRYTTFSIKPIEDMLTHSHMGQQSQNTFKWSWV